VQSEYEQDSVGESRSLDVQLEEERKMLPKPEIPPVIEQSVSVVLMNK